jgi:lipoprotein-anchoring transpeptidase ErfK/SrfK
MKRWIGFLGSWAIFALVIGLFAFAAAGEFINLRDLKRLDRVATIDQIIRQRGQGKTAGLRQEAQQKATEVNALANRVATVTHQTEDVPDTGQTIIVSTAENHLYVRQNGKVIFDAICSTGKGTRLAIDGKTKVFETPIGRFHIKSKDENPEWVPPDWHYVEEAQKSGMRVVHLNPGSSIDAATGEPAGQHDEGVWSWLGGSTGSSRVLRVHGNSVVEVSGGVERPLPPGATIVAGNTIVVPPVNTIQRHYTKVLGQYRLELGDGYGIHGTDQPDKLGQSVSHGCVRLGDADIARLFQMANVGDEVIIY